MDYYGLSLLVAAMLTAVSCEGPTPAQTETSILEDGAVALSYDYPKLALGDSFYWYRQYSGKPPEFLISHTDKGQIVLSKISQLKIHVENKRVDLLISSAALTDSAVYYCAVRPTVAGNTRTVYKNLQYCGTSTRGPHTLLDHC